MGIYTSKQPKTGVCKNVNQSLVNARTINPNCGAYLIFYRFPETALRLGAIVCSIEAQPMVLYYVKYVTIH